MDNFIGQSQNKNCLSKKFVDFKGVMSDQIDRIVASKNSVLFRFYQNYSKECNFFLFHQIIGILG